VDLEGKRAVSSLDIFARAGKNKAFDIFRLVNVTDNELSIVFTTVVDNAMISGMKILPTALPG
jgi:Malectin domain